MIARLILILFGCACLGAWAWVIWAPHPPAQAACAWVTTVDAAGTHRAEVCTPGTRP